MAGASRALQVLVRRNLLADFLTLFESQHGLLVMARVGIVTHLLVCDGLLRRLVKLIDRLLVMPKINLAADQNDGKTLAEVEDLRDPLLTCQPRLSPSTEG